MDPITLGIALAFGGGIATVTTEILKKAADAALQPIIEHALVYAQGMFADDEKKKAFGNAVDAAIDKALAVDAATDAQKYQFRIALTRIALPGQERLREEIAAVMFLMSREEQTFISNELLGGLGLQDAQRPALARFLYFLRAELYELDEFHALLNLAHQRNVENALHLFIGYAAAIERNTGIVASAVKHTPRGGVIQTQQVEKEWNARPYLNALKKEFERFRLDLFKDETPGVKPVTLDQIYTELYITEKFMLDEEGNPIWDSRKLTRPPRLDENNAVEVVNVTALQAVSDPETPAVVLLGYPGSGKSTFVNHLALCLVQEQLTADGADGIARLEGWARGALFPVRVILRDLIRWMDKIEREQERAIEPSAQTIWDFIEYQTKQLGHPDDFPFLRDHFKQHGGLFLFDGLDEVRGASTLRGGNTRRDFIKKSLDSFVRFNSNSRFIVTCRPYAYLAPSDPSQPDWRLEGFRQHTLARFSREQIEAFVNRWYEITGPRDGKDADWIQAKQNQLLRAVENHKHIEELGQEPLLLTLMAVLNANNQLPDDRADLYARIVRFLLNDWEIQKEGESLSDYGLDVEKVERILRRVAYDAHHAQGLDARARQKDVADIRAETLRKAFKPALGSGDRAEDFVAFIQTRTNLLKAQDDETYTFPHRSFQEYLAASYALELLPKDELVKLVRGDRVWWREVYLLAAGRGRNPNFGNAFELLNALCYRDVDKAQWNESNARDALLASQAAADVRLTERAPEEERWGDMLERLQNWLAKIVEHENTVLPFSERVEAGVLLAKLGDLRDGVNANDFLFCEIPAGDFLMGNTAETDAEAFEDEQPQFTYTIKNNFYITRYPITNAQFQAFEDDPNGYAKDEWWTEAGKKWRGEQTQHEKYGGVFDLPNHPVVGVTFYEAVAFCRWLNEKFKVKSLKLKVWGKDSSDTFSFELGTFDLRLPTEAEWERAARAKDGRTYPWGADIDAERANYDATGLNTTSAVGAFPLGASKEGVLDMSGNVWEWCATKWTENYENYSPNIDVEGDALLVVRGGSCVDGARGVRCAFRNVRLPHDIGANPGFRVVVSPVASEL